MSHTAAEIPEDLRAAYEFAKSNGGDSDKPYAVTRLIERIAALTQERDGLREALYNMIEIAEHCAPSPEHEGSCGSESMCDGQCVDAANCAEMIRKARAALAAWPRGKRNRWKS